MKLSENFTLAEAVRSRSASKLGIDNTPNSKQIHSMTLVAKNVLQPLRNFWGRPIRVNSFFRSQKLNKKIGGARNSAHTHGKAADIEAAGVSNYNLAVAANTQTRATKIILEHAHKGDDESGWVHVEYDDSGVRKLYTAVNRKRAKRLGLKPRSKAAGLRKTWYIDGLHDLEA